MDALAAAAHGFVGADLAAICDEAAMAALRRIITFKQSRPTGTLPPCLQHPPTQQADVPQLDHAVTGTPPAPGRDPHSHRQPDGLIAEQQLHDGASTAEHDQAYHVSPSRMLPIAHAADSNTSVLAAEAEHEAVQNAAPPDARASPQPVHAHALHKDGNHSLKQHETASSLKADNLELGQSTMQIMLADVKVAETRVRPSAMREVALEVPHLTSPSPAHIDLHPVPACSSLHCACVVQSNGCLPPSCILLNQSKVMLFMTEPWHCPQSSKPCKLQSLTAAGRPVILCHRFPRCSGVMWGAWRG